MDKKEKEENEDYVRQYRELNGLKGGLKKKRNISNWIGIVIAIIMIGGCANFISKCSQGAVQAENTPVVSNSEWDGSVYQVEDYLKGYLKDPDSFQAIQWGKVTYNSTDACYTVYLKYRAKNSFGGYVISEQEFYLNKEGDVIGATNLDDE